ncbi:MAG: iron-containing alcohol dehydrogenase [Spirochaetota bacterium]
MQRFTVARTPRLVFGDGRVAELAGLLEQCSASRVLLVVSRSALADTATRDGLLGALSSAGIDATMERYDRLPDDRDPFTAPRGPFREASPDVVDALAAAYRTAPPHAVVAIGGGSAIDTGKALAVALREDGSIVDVLEGVGTRSPSGATLPFFAVPTTAGTGSEATKNAVLSRPGDDGFKKSLRHDNFVPDVALVDPQMHLSCPREVTAASGLDAITQLLEAYVSTDATPLTDALALDGLAAAGRAFLRVVERGESDLEARGEMAYAAYLSGVCLANAGLGTVHGLAGAAGAVTDVPHGVFCGRLLPHVVERTVHAVTGRRDALGTLGKYAAAGRALSGRSSGSLEDQIQMLIARLNEFGRVGALPGLGEYGFDDATIERVARAGGNKANPYQFNVEEQMGLLAACR